MSLPAKTTPNLPSLKARAATAALWVVSLVGIIGGVIALVTVKDVTWVASVVVGLIGVVNGVVQTLNQRENAANVARIGEDLKRRSLVYERRLAAYVDVTKVMLRIIETADNVLLVLDPERGVLPERRPTDMFVQLIDDLFRDWSAQRAALHILADDEARKILDSFDRTITSLYREHSGPPREKGQGSQPISPHVLTQNLPRLSEARDAFARDYEAFRVHAQAQLRE